MTFDLKRRHLLQALAAAPVLAAPGLARAASAAAGPADSADNWMLQFQATQRDVDWRLGYVTPNDNLKASAISVRGRLKRTQCTPPTPPSWPRSNRVSSLACRAAATTPSTT